MRHGIRSLINGMAGVAGARVVNARWGPRGFAEALRRLKGLGVDPKQIVDVGAAEGLWTSECLEVLPEARYLMIDPLEENRAALERARGSNPNISIWTGALGAQAGTLALRASGDQSSFLEGPMTAGGTIRQVSVRTLDSFLGSELVGPPDFIKADVQGYEIEVLKGAQRCLEAAQLLLLEVSFRRLYVNCPLAHDVVSYVGARGFRIYDICTYAQRPRDGELVQADMLFARDGSRAFSSEGYD
jgi:FkbM family methyltransferase